MKKAALKKVLGKYRWHIRVETYDNNEHMRRFIVNVIRMYEKKLKRREYT